MGENYHIRNESTSLAIDESNEAITYLGSSSSIIQLDANVEENQLFEVKDLFKSSFLFLSPLNMVPNMLCLLV